MFGFSSEEEVVIEPPFRLSLSFGFSSNSCFCVRGVRHIEVIASDNFRSISSPLFSSRLILSVYFTDISAFGRHRSESEEVFSSLPPVFS